MQIHEVRQGLEGRVKSLPVVRSLLERRYERFFCTAEGMNLFRGVYSSMDEARRTAPPTKGLGYDDRKPAEMYRERLTRVYPNDYPVLFWLKSILEERRKVFDLGGHVGIAFYAYDRYLHYSDGLKWLVYDVPAVVREGERLALERGKKGLSFTSHIADGSGADVLLASGSLQYIEEPFESMLSEMGTLPRNLILNKTPITEGEPFVTLQNIGTAFCPYAIFNRRTFVESLSKLGYELVDAWENPEHGCPIPFHPQRSVLAYSGFYFRLSS